MYTYECLCYRPYQYNADLTTYLTVKTKLKLPKSYGEMASSDYGVMTWKGSVYDTSFQELDKNSAGYLLTKKWEKTSLPYPICPIDCTFQTLQVRA